MRETPRFRDLEQALRHSGIDSGVVERTVLELQEHYLDLVDEAQRSGYRSYAAHAYAARTLGKVATIADVVRQHEELRGFSARHPMAAACGRSVCCAIALPLVPVLYCAQRREALMRWGVSFGLASLVTASLLLALYSLLPY